MTFLSQLKSTLLYSLVGDHRSEGRSFARKTFERSPTKWSRLPCLWPLLFYSYLSTCCFEFEKAYTHTLPLDVGFASDV